MGEGRSENTERPSSVSKQHVEPRVGSGGSRTHVDRRAWHPRELLANLARALSFEHPEPFEPHVLQRDLATEPATAVIIRAIRSPPCATLTAHLTDRFPDRLALVERHLLEHRADGITVHCLGNDSHDPAATFVGIAVFPRL